MGIEQDSTTRWSVEDLAQPREAKATKGEVV